METAKEKTKKRQGTLPKYKMGICEATGLLYIEEVPFTLDHLKKLRKLFKYQKNLNQQFNHNVFVLDKNTNKSVKIDVDLIDDIFKLYDTTKIARDKDFQF